MPIYWIIFQREYNGSNVIKINSDIYLSIRKEILRKNLIEFPHNLNIIKTAVNLIVTTNFHYFSPLLGILISKCLHPPQYHYQGPLLATLQTKNSNQAESWRAALGRHSSLVEQQRDYSSARPELGGS